MFLLSIASVDFSLHYLSSLVPSLKKVFTKLFVKIIWELIDYYVLTERISWYLRTLALWNHLNPTVEIEKFKSWAAAPWVSLSVCGSRLFLVWSSGVPHTKGKEFTSTNPHLGSPQNPILVSPGQCQDLCTRYTPFLGWCSYVEGKNLSFSPLSTTWSDM